MKYQLTFAGVMTLLAIAAIVFKNKPKQFFDERQAAMTHHVHQMK